MHFKITIQRMICFALVSAIFVGCTEVDPKPNQSGTSSTEDAPGNTNPGETPPQTTAPSTVTTTFDPTQPGSQGNTQGNPFQASPQSISPSEQKALDYLTKEAGLNATTKNVDNLKIAAGGRVKLGPLTDEQAAAIADLPNVERVVLQKVALSNSGLEHFADLGKLEELDLRGVQGITDDGLKHLSTLPNLKDLSLGETKITGSGLAHLKTLRALEKLDLVSCPNISDEAIDPMIQLKSLKIVYLYNTKVTDQGKQKLKTERPDIKIE